MQMEQIQDAMSSSIVPNGWNGGDKKNTAKGKCRENLGERQPALELLCCFLGIFSLANGSCSCSHSYAEREVWLMLKQYSSTDLKHSKWGKPSSVAAGSTGGLNTA